ncbi:hypothetical protein G7Z17_g4097 [Cylindrodendrum hubeiense]|uniref:NB-ARC domain-containing protein n=1 Tax=Cylindrodendrum hubeiense TaxID=595255 RepID=A0A9P5LHH8_9HYPO|nr:hypothetical protein G7Z17_g4097 [Cylindrodendrum hubeiense]
MRNFLQTKRDKYLPTRQGDQCEGNAATTASSSIIRAFPVGVKLLHSSNEDIVDVIFVHGLSGNPDWAERMSLSINVIKQTNSKIVEVLRRDSEVLARIQDSFHAIILARNKTKEHMIEITCFYEELPMPRIGFIVPQDSAILPGYIPIGIHGNHKQMTKYAKADDAGLVAICSELKRWVKAIDLNDGQDSSQTGEIHQPKASTSHSEDITIALAYVYWLQEIHPEVSVFWIHASNAERFRQGFAYIAQECEIPGYDDPRSDVLQLVKVWLEKKNRGRWLMVIDNADDTQVFFSQQPESANTPSHHHQLGRYIPECAHGALLVTTRNLEAGSRLTMGNPPIGVGNMDESESVQLLRTRLGGIETSSEELSSLSSRLEYLPLALAQAAAFIRENVIQVKDYLKLLDEGDHNLVALLSEEFETIERQNPLASQLLCLMCLLDRQDIPIEFMFYYAKESQDSGRVKPNI